MFKIMMAMALEDADVTVATKREPTEEEWEALKLGWNVVKHVKSNAIVVTDTGYDAWRRCWTNEPCRRRRDCA